MTKSLVRNLILVFGDQLTEGLASLRTADPARDVVLMGEVRREATHSNHHKKSIIFFFAAMRAFAEKLRACGWRVDYSRLDGDEPCETFTDLVASAVTRHAPQKVVAVEPAEWPVREEFRRLAEALNLSVDLLPDDRFICSDEEFAAWAAGKKSLRMEFFYREMRKKTGLLMDGDAPAGGRWNFDAENRKTPLKGERFAGPTRFEPDRNTQEVIDFVEREFGGHFGDARPFWFATTREGALRALDHFIETGLAGFGDYQDAMLKGERFLNHAVLSMYLNAGLLSPLEVCVRAEAAWRKGAAPINSVEGFIRQIIGWREFIRGTYRREGPDYVRRNHLGAHAPLPWFYWSGETKMTCMRAVVQQTREEAYAHHIQRLMVGGNFALIAGVDPHEIHEWYLSVYADALEWVEAPNTIGMSQFADGGLVASKPYAASGAYINRMSDYCKGCRYSPKKKTEDDACPFNALYWDFLDRNRAMLGANPRLMRSYQSLDRMADAQREAFRNRAAFLKNNLENL